MTTKDNQPVFCDRTCGQIKSESGGQTGLQVTRFYCVAKPKEQLVGQEIEPVATVQTAPMLTVEGIKVFSPEKTPCRFTKLKTSKTASLVKVKRSFAI